MLLKYDILIIEYKFEFIKSGYTLKVYKALKRRKKDIKIAVIYFDSIKNKGKSKYNCNYFGLDCFDIRFFNTINICYILKKLSPRIVIMFNHSFLMDRAVIKACKKCNIPTFFLQHGVQTNKQLRKKISVKSLIDKTERYSRYVLYYLNVDFPSFFKLSTWEFLLKALFINISQVPDSPTDETHCDFAFVWGERYRKLYKKLNGYPDNKIYTIGCPDMDVLSSNMIRLGGPFKKLKFDNYYNKKNVEILYITQPFTRRSNVKKNEYRVFMEELFNICKKHKIKLYLGVHPKDNYSYQEYCSKQSFEIVQESSKLIPHVSLVIGHFSSLLGTALVCGKPVIILDIFSNYTLPYIEGITNLSRCVCKSIKELERNIVRIVGEDKETKEKKSQEISQKAQEYFLFNTEGVFDSFAEIILKYLESGEIINII